MDKSATTVAITLEDVFVTSGRQPRRLRTDKGREFLGHAVQNILCRRGVVFFTSQHSTKASLWERFNRTLRGETISLLHGYQCAQIPTRVGGPGTRLQSHCPQHHKNETAVVNALNQHVVWKRMFGHLLHRRKAQWQTPASPPQFKVGDLVRIAKEKGAFEKAYLTNWTSSNLSFPKSFSLRPVTTSISSRTCLASL